MGEYMANATWRVDGRCTNCDAARQFAPGLIAEVDGRSSVVRQPHTDAEEKSLQAAAFACHTRSIRRGARGPDPELDPFPLPLTEHVHLCGHNSPRTAGANSYLLRRPSGNLMMIDTPRWSRALATKYAALGRVSDVLLTHRDPAAHGRAYADRFGARLWIHEGDLAAAPTGPGPSTTSPSPSRSPGTPSPSWPPRSPAQHRGCASRGCCPATATASTCHPTSSPATCTTWPTAPQALPRTRSTSLPCAGDPPRPSGSKISFPGRRPESDHTNSRGGSRRIGIGPGGGAKPY
jgi:hypothetical protein